MSSFVRAPHKLTFIDVDAYGRDRVCDVVVYDNDERVGAAVLQQVHDVKLALMAHGHGLLTHFLS